MIFANTLCLLLGCRRYTVYSIYDITYIGAICDILHGLHNVDSFISLLGFKIMEHTSLSVLIQTSWLPARKYFSWIFLKTIWSCLITSGYVWRNHGNQWQLYKPCRVSSELRHLTPPGLELSGCGLRIMVTAQYQAAPPFTSLDPNLSDPLSHLLSYSCLGTCPLPCLTPRFCHIHHIANPLQRIPDKT